MAFITPISKSMIIIFGLTGDLFQVQDKITFVSISSYIFCYFFGRNVSVLFSSSAQIVCNWEKTLEHLKVPFINHCLADDNIISAWKVAKIDILLSESLSLFKNVFDLPPMIVFQYSGKTNCILLGFFGKFLRCAQQIVRRTESVFPIVLHPFSVIKIKVI